jgi:hypothetical protein
VWDAGLQPLQITCDPGRASNNCVTSLFDSRVSRSVLNLTPYPRASRFRFEALVANAIEPCYRRCMTRLFLALIILASPALACEIRDGLPDPRCTPGATDPRVTQENIHSTICVPGYSKSVRPPVAVTNKLKRQVMQEYGMEGQDLATVEGDHIIPISSGGCAGPDVGCDFHANFFPQLWTGPNNAHDKDKIEWALHRMICSGRISLSEAQKRIATDWEHALDGMEP